MVARTIWYGKYQGVRAIVASQKMAWARMLFRGQVVWVRVDGRGRPVLDGGGRAEMKYREEDTKTYRPSASNLTPAEGEVVEDPPPRRRARAEEPSAAPDVPAAERIDVWTDGACSGNPGPMGIGVVVLASGGRREHGEYLGIGTNNIAELVAIERGLEVAGDVDAGKGARAVHVFSDSSYAIGVLSKGWKAKANQELVARIREVVKGDPRIRLVKVPGHAGVPENERCDELARAAIARRGTV
jgi:ribonuclease HI